MSATKREREREREERERGKEVSDTNDRYHKTSNQEDRQ